MNVFKKENVFSHCEKTVGVVGTHHHIYIFLLGIRDQGGIESRVADRGEGSWLEGKREEKKDIIKGALQRTFWYTRDKVSEGT